MAHVRKHEVKQRFINAARGLIAFISLWSGASFMHASTGTLTSLEDFTVPLGVICAVTAVFTVVSSVALYRDEE